MAASPAGAAAAAGSKLPRLRFGRKPVYLPNFTLTLLRTPFLPPDYATFIAPLHLNKLDIKDYLWHAYGVRVLGVRAYVQQQRVREDKPGAILPMPRRWFRPRGYKKMTVRMERGFVWPDEPTDFKAWDKDTHAAISEAQQRENERLSPQARMEPNSDERASMAEQARRLLAGEERWEPSSSSWMHARSR